MRSIKGRLTTGHSARGGAPLIPMNAAQWCFEAKKLDFLVLNIPESPIKLSIFCFSTQLT